MKTIFTILIGLMFGFASFGQQYGCNANFTYTVDENTSTIHFYDGSWASDSLNPQIQATSWSWNIAGVNHTTSSVAYNYTSLPVSIYVCLTASFDNGCESTFCDSVYVEATDSCNGFYVDAGYDVVAPSMCSGELTAAITGGTAPYTYNWGANGNTATISGLCEGNYPITALDANGCSATSIGYVLVDNGGSQIIDSLTNTPIDTCIDFTVVSVYVSNTTIIDSNTVQIEWTFIDDQQGTHIFYETYTFGGQQGNYYVSIAIDCNGNKVLTQWGEVITISSTTGITNVEAITELKLYPNPVKDVATIEYNVESSSKVNISIIDYTGKIVKSTTVNSYQGNNTITFNTSELNSGVYFVRITSDNTAKTIKFIK